jgi:hypothetical protein
LSASARQNMVRRTLIDRLLPFLLSDEFYRCSVVINAQTNISRVSSQVLRSCLRFRSSVSARTRVRQHHLHHKSANLRGALSKGLAQDSPNEGDLLSLTLAPRRTRPNPSSHDFNNACYRFRLNYSMAHIPGPEEIGVRYSYHQQIMLV